MRVATAVLDVLAKIGCINRVAPVRSREGYVVCRAWGVVAKGACDESCGGITGGCEREVEATGGAGVGGRGAY